jgi:hypothetical protein
MIDHQESLSRDPIEIAKRYHSLAKDRYWKHKDLAGAITLFDEGIGFANSEMAHCLDLAKIKEMNGVCKAMHYDVASFCWPGWNESGIAIGPGEVLRGERAAHKNLELAFELGRTGAPLADAHWMLGAYNLCFGRLEKALEMFGEFERIAVAAEDEGRALLASGYLALTQVLQGDQSAKARLSAIQSELEAGNIEEGKFLAEQLSTALSALHSTSLR